MRIHTCKVAAAAALLMVLGLSGCFKEMSQTVTINEDGTAKALIVQVVDRPAIEQRIQMVRRMREQEEGLEEEPPAEGDEPADQPAPKKEEEKPEPTPAEKSAALAADVKALLTRSGPWGLAEQPEGVTITVDSVDVQEDTVRIVVSMAFKDLKSMVANMHASWPGGGTLRLEKDEEGKLRLTFSMTGSGRYRRMEIARMKQMLTTVKATGSWTFVMPGKVLSSSLPDVKDNTASLTFDTGEQASVDVLKKILTDGVVIVAEPGRLKMDDFPLDSMKLVMARYAPPPGPGRDLPIVDAAPGFAVKALSVTTSSVHYFDGAENIPENLEMMMASGSRSGCVVHARLFPPKDRRILSLESVRVIQAVDDRNREVKPVVEGEEQGGFGYRGSVFSARGDEPKWVDLELSLSLPQPDAAAVEKMQAEAIVTSFGRWKEHTVSDPKGDPKVVIDLGDVLPGSTLVIKEIKTRRLRTPQQLSSAAMVIEVKGPPGVQSLEFTVRAEEVPAEERGFRQSYVTKDTRAQVQDKTVRTLTLSTHEAGPTGGKQVLVVRYPDEIRRERVTFTLEALDLF